MNRETRMAFDRAIRGIVGLRNLLEEDPNTFPYGMYFPEMEKTIKSIRREIVNNERRVRIEKISTMSEAEVREELERRLRLEGERK